VAALALVLVSALAGTGLARWLRAPDERKEAKAATGMPSRLFRDWPKPDFVLVMSGQQLGYLLPCGCSRPQVGGLERRYNFLKLLDKQGWPYVAVDLGDVPQRHGPVALPNLQGLIKYRYSMAALKEMGYSAVSFGETETVLSLFHVLGEYALQHETPRVVVANLKKVDDNAAALLEMTKRYAVARVGKKGLKVGVTAVVGPTVERRIKDPAVRFRPSPAALNEVLKELDKEKVDLRVLLYQGLTTANRMRRPPTEAVACAEAYPQFPVLLCLSQEDEPPANPIWVTNPKTGGRSLVVTVGRKGKCVGVVGVWRTGKPKEPFTFRYQLVELTEDFLTPKDQEENHPIGKLMADYTAELKKDNYLGRYGQVKHLLQAMAPVLEGGKPLKDNKGALTPRYVGSFTCRRCHKSAYEVWVKSPHSHAYRTLAEAKRPDNRQYDPECIVCHTVGFAYQGGFVDAVKTPHLMDVGCESCHGPASMHVAHPDNVAWQRRLNPWKHLPAAKRKDSMDEFCQKCHDVDNDVTWVHGGFGRKWPKIAHPTPKE
jgi:hypothetical protein